MWDVKDHPIKEVDTLYRGFILTMWDVKEYNFKGMVDGDGVLSRLCGM